MDGDIVLIGHNEDKTIIVFMYYDYTRRKLVVVCAQRDAADIGYEEDTARRFESDSRANAEAYALSLCREFDIPEMEEYVLAASSLPISREEMDAWVKPALPYLN